MSVQIEFDLKELLIKLDQKIDNIQKEVTDIKVSVIRLEGEVESSKKELKGEIASLRHEVKGDIESLRHEVKGDVNVLNEKINVLNEKIDGVSKRIDNQEFINRGVAIGIFVAILGGAAKLFGFVSNP